MRTKISDAIFSRAHDSIQALHAAIDEIESVTRIISHAINSGKTVYLIGNGGSAADCQHLAAEFVGRYKHPNNHLPAVALTTDTSVITSIANDYGYENIFSMQLEALCRTGDVVIGISTSGNSTNVLRGLHVANTKGARTIGLLGREGGLIAPITEASIIIPLDRTELIQECHIMVGHIICEIIDDITTAIPEIDYEI